MSRVLLLDAGPLGLVTNPKLSPQPTAGDKTIDGDMILAGQAAALGEADLIIATTNVGHLGRFAPADLWQNINH